MHVWPDLFAHDLQCKLPPTTSKGPFAFLNLVLKASSMMLSCSSWISGLGDFHEHGSQNAIGREHKTNTFQASYTVEARCQTQSFNPWNRYTRQGLHAMNVCSWFPNNIKPESSWLLSLCLFFSPENKIKHSGPAKSRSLAKTRGLS